MEVVRGTAKNVRHGNEIVTTRSGKNNHVETRNNVVFNIETSDGNMPVELKSKTIIHINDGDEIVVAGNVKDGVLKSMAAHNITNGTTHNSKATILYIFAAIMTVVSFTLPSVMWICLPLGLYGLWAGIYSRKADILVKQATA